MEIRHLISTQNGKLRHLTVTVWIPLLGITMAITTTTSLPSPVQQSFSYKLLSVPVPNMIHKIPAMKKNMPRNGGNTLRMRRYNPLNTAMVPLGNSGVTPPPQNLTAVDIDAKISFYGKGAVVVWH
jgi:N4-gp56 family major capsid protein